MSTELTQSMERLRQGFRRYLNPFMLSLWRLGLSEWFQVAPEYSGQIMVLTHIGRKSGLLRRQPLNYAIVDGDVYCVAGFGAVSDWYKNIRANPQVQVWLPEGWWEGIAEDVSASPDRLQLIRKIMIASGFAAYAAGLDPKKMSEAELDAATRTYPLIRIKRTAARTGKGGPGDLAWVWPLATFVLLTMLLSRRKK